jgi:hypothetical protein
LGSTLRQHIRAAIVAALLFCVLSAAIELKAVASNDLSLGTQPVEDASEVTFEKFLDQLMRAESNGRDEVANPRSTALGAFQFIKSTFRSIARAHFAREVAELSDEQLLALRTNRDFARRAAAAYCRENAAYLHQQGLRPTFGHLRLAYLLGAGGAAKVLKAPPQTALADILGVSVLRANPFMKGKTAVNLIERAVRDIEPRVEVASSSQDQSEHRSAPALPVCRVRMQRYLRGGALPWR